MSKLIQIREVSDQTDRRLEARAAVDGRTLSDYLRRELDELAARPERAEVLARIERRAVIEPERSPAELIHAERESRER